MLQQAGRMLRQSQRFPPQNPSVGRDPRWDVSLCSGCNSSDSFVDLINVHESVDFQYI